MYAVIETGGKQYRVEVGTVLEVEKLEVEAGQTVTLERVLLVADGDDAAIGRPVVEGASVSAEVVRQDRADKVIVFKYRPKARRRVKKGHRQALTVLRISDITLNGRSAAMDAAKAMDAARTERERLEEAAERQAAADAELAAKLAAKAEKAAEAEAEAKAEKAAEAAEAEAEVAKADAKAKGTRTRAAKAEVAKADEAPVEEASADEAPDAKAQQPRRRTTKKDG